MTFHQKLAQMMGHLGVFWLGAGVLRLLFDYQPADLPALFAVILVGVFNIFYSAKWG